MRIHTFEHVPFEGPGAIATFAKAAGHELARTRLFADEPLPSVKDFDLLVIMGGPMGVYDEKQHAWMPREKEFLRLAMAAGRSVLGVCLGAQLLAEALGAAVTRNPVREIGWLPVRLTPWGKTSPAFAGFPEEFSPFHWHGDTFGIARGASCLASSTACANQAFAVGAKFVGLQFHLETTAETMELLIENCADEIAEGGPCVQSADAMRQGAGGLPALNGLMDRLLRNMAREI